MSFLVPAAVLAGLTLPAIVLLYFLKARRPEVRVATLMFWRPHLADRQANAPWQRLRPSLLLLLQLLAALLLAVGLMRPGLIGAAGIASTTVVMVDASPSMQATDVSPTRFQAALERARSEAGQLRPGQEMALILLGEHAQLLSAPTGDSASLQAALARARPAGVAGNFAEGVSLANSILQGKPGGSIKMISDGHSQAPPSPPSIAAPLVYESVGRTSENAAIQTISRSPGGAVYMRLANYGRSARELKVEMRADGRVVDEIPVRLDGNSTADLPAWTRLPARARVLEARLTPPDAFPLDDSAWLVIADPPKHAVLLVTSGNSFLQRALALRPGLDVTVAKPGEEKAGRYDLYVYDSYLPPGRVPGPALLVNPPAGRGPVALGASLDPGAVLPANTRDPLLRDVSLKDVHVQSAGSLKDPPAGWRTVVSAAANPLLLVHDDDPRSAVLTFDLHHSDLPLRAGFPILAQNLLSYLLPGGFENQIFRPGQAVTLAAEADARALEVTRPDGGKLRLTPPFAPFRDTLGTGVYTVRQELAGGTRLSQFVVQLQDPAMSRIAPGAAPVTQEAEKIRGVLPRGTIEIWPWLVGAALVLLAAEWAVYLRGR
ncbi:MAG: VWA domain-containing protein [Candidatus Dormibacteraeota bacterium]|nr:VWA domain-containing protein [Candidatus Dormibacteraeota bacterium]